jgi:hypothetical protein
MIQHFYTMDYVDLSTLLNISFRVFEQLSSFRKPSYEIFRFAIEAFGNLHSNFDEKKLPVERSLRDEILKKLGLLDDLSLDKDPSAEFLNHFSQTSFSANKPNLKMCIPSNSLLSWTRRSVVSKKKSLICNEWMIRVLLDLEHPHFSNWLDALCLGDFLLLRICLDTNLSLVLYMLLLITSCEHAYRWYESPSEHALQYDDYCTSAQPRAVAVYLRAFAHVLLEFCAKLTTSVSRSAILDDFLATAYHETPTDTLRKRASTGRSIPVGHRLAAGALDLCEKVLNACAAQAVASHVHAAAVNVLLLPYMPWRLQTRIWAEFGRLRLAHLLELEPAEAEVAGETVTQMRRLFDDVCDEYCNEDELRVDESLAESIALTLFSLRKKEDKQLSVACRGIKLVRKYLRINPNKYSDFLKLSCNSSTVIMEDILNETVTNIVE